MPIKNEDGTVLVDCQGDIILQYKVPTKDDPSVVLSLVQGSRTVGPGGRWSVEDLANVKGVKPLVSIRVSDVRSVDAILHAFKVVRDVLSGGVVMTPEEAISRSMAEQVARDIDAQFRPLLGWEISKKGA